MKRLLCVFLLTALLTPLALGQGVAYIGIVTYPVDALVGSLPEVGVALGSAMGVTIDLYETPPATFCTRDELSEKLSRLSIAAQQAEYLRVFSDQKVDGIVVSPAPPVLDANDPVKAELETIALTIPVAITVRPIEGLDLPFFGLDAYRLGVAWAAANVGKPFAVIGYFLDPLQAQLLEGLKTSPYFKGSYPVFKENGKAEASQAVRDIPDLAALVVADPSFAAGAAEVTKYTKQEMNHPISLSALGAPAEYVDLFAQGLLQGFVTWDHYQLLLKAATAVKDQAASGVPATGQAVEALVYVLSGQITTVAAPYEGAEVFAELWK